MRFFLLLFVVPGLFVTECFGKNPVIGISSSGDRSGYAVRSTYTGAVSKADGIPVILPMVFSEKEAAAVVSVIDALVMTGGEDVNPSYYGESVINGTVEVNASRDTSDFLLISAAMNKGIPILGICRGEQLVNVFFGGTLYQDLPSQRSGPVAHRQKEDSGVGTHWVYLEKESLLYRLTGRDSLMVNSFHHQAVKELADGLTVSARAADGVVEAYEGKGVICVQFHPEALVTRGRNNALLPLFFYLSNLARQSGN